jgi:hypothetical protein
MANLGTAPPIADPALAAVRPSNHSNKHHPQKLQMTAIRRELNRA